ncbi:MAG: hypothetical protein GC187_06455 [Alphaproteobacteria bacterium]|nr:hypothetical protein [Alphaproteobacteria bacterium]
MITQIPSLVVVGFPKCGTSALIRELGRREGVKVLTAPNGALELVWPAIKAHEAQATLGHVTLSDTRLVCHKFAAYMFNKKAIQYLAEDINRKFVVCIRDPARSLVSWWNMHKNIAISGESKNHFAYKERDFYANCDVGSYYIRYAKDRLRYDRYIASLLNEVGVERVFVVSQERMASNLLLAADRILEFSGATAPDKTNIPIENEHISFAQKANVALPDAIQQELDHVYGATLAMLLKNNIRRLI